MLLYNHPIPGKCCHHLKNFERMYEIWFHLLHATHFMDNLLLRVWRTWSYCIVSLWTDTLLSVSVPLGHHWHRLLQRFYLFHGQWQRWPCEWRHAKWTVSDFDGHKVPGDIWGSKKWIKLFLLKWLVPSDLKPIHLTFLLMWTNRLCDYYLKNIATSSTAHL